MQFSRRRLTFQLTPLLDLLLIVIFAQYLEMQETTAAIHAQQQQQSETKDRQLNREMELARQEVERALAAVTEMQQRVQQDKTRLIQREVELQEAAQNAVDQRDRAGKVFAELFNIPTTSLNAVLAPQSNDVKRSATEVERLRHRLQQLAQDSGRDVIRHLLTFQEIRKRCDLWQVHLREDGVIEFSAGAEVAVLRAGTSEEFATRMFAQYKQWPQPKGLVVMLISWGDAEFGNRESIIDGLPLLTGRLQADSGDRTRFEYALLGYQPDFRLRPADKPSR